MFYCYSLTRYVSLHELIDGDFFHREPPPSYSIAVGETSGDMEDYSSDRSHRTRPWRQVSSTPIKPPTPPSSETSNHSSPSRESITSSSYLSNEENGRFVAPENAQFVAPHNPQFDAPENAQFVDPENAQFIALENPQFVIPEN